jgi:putative FmdB family regulatory protein
MPLYAYKCTHCDHEFEVRQRFSDKPLTECPVCGGHIRRVIGSVGIVFKGSGFYVTDNRNGKSNGLANGGGKKTDSAKTRDDKSSETISNVSPQSHGKEGTAASSTTS